MHNIKHHITFLIFVFTSWVAFGQTQSRGVMKNDETKTPIPDVLILNTTTTDTLFSDNKGYFPIKSKGIYVFKKEGFSTKTASINEVEHIVILLSPNPSQLNEVTIIANTNQTEATNTINIISKETIDQTQNVNFNQAFNLIPGVFMQSGALNTNRITIRGIGSRNLFGTAKIRAYFKDIPLTNGSGETNIEDFELASISNMQIVKGPTSSIYGAGLGGTIIINPEKLSQNHSEANSELTVGSFNLFKNTNKIGLRPKNNSFNLVHSQTESDGFRENNHYNRQTFTINSNHAINPNNNLSFLGSYVDLKAFIPSSISETNFLNNPKMADPNWRAAKGHEDSKRGVFGLSWEHLFKQKSKLKSSVFLSFRDAYEPRPFNILKDETLAYGLRTRLESRTKIFNIHIEYTIGGEWFKDRYNYKTFENRYRDFPDGTGSVEGNNLSHFEENRLYYNLFFETQIEVSKKTTLSAGANLNQTEYNLTDYFPISENNPDQSGAFKFKTILSPKFGINYQTSKKINLFGNISHGFSPITLNETLLPNGQINPNIKPETGWNFEIGIRGTTTNKKLNYSVSAFSMHIKNLLVSRRTAEDQFIGINAGKTRHNGVETNLNYIVKHTENGSLQVFSNLTWNRFKFKEFIDNDNNYSGNDLTGVPSHIFNLGLSLNSKNGFYGNIHFQHVGEIPITDSNSLYSDSYNLSRLKTGFKTNLNKKLKLNLFFGLNNIFDTAYASQILINASSFGGNAPRYYYPGNTINFYTGINLNYLF
ncbi:TonB-dependent receptor [Tamlana crocina]